MTAQTNETLKRLARTHFTAHDEKETHAQRRKLAQSALDVMMAANSEIFGLQHAAGPGSIYKAACDAAEMLVGTRVLDLFHEEGELRPDCACGCDFGTHGEGLDLNGYSCEACHDYLAEDVTYNKAWDLCESMTLVVVTDRVTKELYGYNKPCVDVGEMLRQFKVQWAAKYDEPCCEVAIEAARASFEARRDEYL